MVFRYYKEKLHINHFWLRVFLVSRYLLLLISRCPASFLEEQNCNVRHLCNSEMRTVCQFWGPKFNVLCVRTQAFTFRESILNMRNFFILSSLLVIFYYFPFLILRRPSLELRSFCHSENEHFLLILRAEKLYLPPNISNLRMVL